MQEITKVSLVLLSAVSFGVYIMLFNEFGSKSSKTEYLELLSKLEENPDDKELKEKTIEAGRAYNQKKVIFTGRSAKPYRYTRVSEEEINEDVENAINNGKKKQKEDNISLLHKSTLTALARASAIYYSLIVSARENGLNPFEYLTWIFTNAPNLGKAGYISEIKDFLPGSTAFPEKVFTPQIGNASPEKYAWEED